MSKKRKALVKLPLLAPDDNKNKGSFTVTCDGVTSEPIPYDADLKTIRHKARKLPVDWERHL